MRTKWERKDSTKRKVLIKPAKIRVLVHHNKFNSGRISMRNKLEKIITKVSQLSIIVMSKNKIMKNWLIINMSTNRLLRKYKRQLREYFQSYKTVKN